jgi:hypothetical protein
MDIAALILSILALISSLACLVLMLAKNFFSTHQVQLQPVDPFANLFPSEMGKPKMDPFQDIDIPLDEDDIDQLKGKKAKF